MDSQAGDTPGAGRRDVPGRVSQDVLDLAADLLESLSPVESDRAALNLVPHKVLVEVCLYLAKLAQDYLVLAITEGFNPVATEAEKTALVDRTFAYQATRLRQATHSHEPVAGETSDTGDTGDTGEAGEAGEPPHRQATVSTPCPHPGCSGQPQQAQTGITTCTSGHTGAPGPGHTSWD
jgi:hypothetical protein